MGAWQTLPYQERRYFMYVLSELPAGNMPDKNYSNLQDCIIWSEDLLTDKYLQIYSSFLPRGRKIEWGLASIKANNGGLAMYHHQRALIVDRAKDLRKRSTEAEAALWEELRKRKLGGYKLRRQYPLIFKSRNFVNPPSCFLPEGRNESRPYEVNYCPGNLAKKAESINAPLGEGEREVGGGRNSLPSALKIMLSSF